MSHNISEFKELHHSDIMYVCDYCSTPEYDEEHDSYSSIFSGPDRKDWCEYCMCNACGIDICDYYENKHRPFEELVEIFSK